MKATSRKSNRKSKTVARKSSRNASRWSGRVTKNSDALDLEKSIFKSRSPKRIAASLKHSAEVSKRRKAGPYQSAMSMLNFYINRAGRNLPASRKAILRRAKKELKTAFGREKK